jgi:sulfur carrier protein ThiS
MICTMAVPAFAAEETIDVVVTVKNYDGDSDSIAVTVEADEATVEEAIKAFNKKNNDNDIEVSVLGTTGLVNKVGGKKAGDIENLFGTGYWAVAVNGKLVAEDLDTVAIEEGDRVVVYWNDPTFDTKLVQVDDSQLAKGVVAFYYYNAEGEKVALEGAKVKLKTAADGILKDALAGGSDVFTTDDKGQIWLQPSYLNANVGATDDYGIEIVYVDIDDLKKADEYDYSKAKMDYYNANLDRNIEDVDAVNYTIDVENLYEDAEATGDMTMVYVLVAAAAVVTLAAVVVMKKKAVKAN